MIAELEKLIVRVMMDAKDYHKKAEGVINRARKVGQAMTSVGKKMTLGLSVPLAAAGFATVQMASSANEIEAKFDTVFKNVNSSAEKFAKNLADNYGMAKAESKELLSSTGDMLTGFGFAEDQALDLSNQVQKLAVDLASFQNLEGGAKRASDALTKGLLGERDSMKALGIAILEEDVKKRVAMLTAQGMTFETERQAKAIATLQIAVEQSKNAVGDYARTQDSFANQQRRLIADVKDLAVELGTHLMPIAKEVLKVLRSGIVWFTGLSDETKKWIIQIALLVAAIGPVLMIVGSLLSSLGTLVSMLGALKGAMAAVGGATMLMKAGLVILVGYLAYKLTSALTGATATYKKLHDEMERGKKLHDAAMDGNERRHRRALDEINLIDDHKTKLEALNAALKQQKAEVVGSKSNVSTAEQEVARLDALWGSSVGRASKLRQVANASLAEQEGHLAANKARVKEIEEAIWQMELAKKRAAKQPMVEKKQEEAVLEDASKDLDKFQEDAAKFGAGMEKQIKEALANSVAAANLPDLDPVKDHFAEMRSEVEEPMQMAAGFERLEATSATGADGLSRVAEHRATIAAGKAGGAGGHEQQNAANLATIAAATAAMASSPGVKLVEADLS